MLTAEVLAMPVAPTIALACFALWQIAKKHVYKGLDALPPQIQAMSVTALACAMAFAASRLGLTVSPDDAVAASLAAIGIHGVTKMDWSAKPTQAGSDVER